MRISARSGECLTDRGYAVVHSIGRMTPPGTTGPFIRKYIFPGGYVPALSEVFASTERLGLWVCDNEILRLHYYYTIRDWRIRFEEKRGAAAELYDDAFCRMWEFYLCAVELGFLHGSNMVFQLLLSRERDAVPIIRDFIVRTMNGKLNGTTLSRQPRRVPSALPGEDLRQEADDLAKVARRRLFLIAGGPVLLLPPVSDGDLFGRTAGQYADAFARYMRNCLWVDRQWVSVDRDFAKSDQIGHHFGRQWFLQRIMAWSGTRYRTRWKRLSEGERPRGASTITMQTAKNLFLWGDRSYIRKGPGVAACPDAGCDAVQKTCAWRSI